jgi:hypothetical protein
MPDSHLFLLILIPVVSKELTMKLTLIRHDENKQTVRLCTGTGILKGE